MDVPAPLDPTTFARLVTYAQKPRGNRSGRTWTVADLLPLLDSTMPVATIAERMGVPRHVVTYELIRLRRAGFDVPERPSVPRQPRTHAIEDALRAGMTGAEVAQRYGLARPRVREIRRRADIPARRRTWTDAERVVVIMHHDRPTAELAALVGRSVRAVDRIRSQLIAEGRIPAKIVRPRTG